MQAKNNFVRAERVEIIWRKFVSSKNGKSTEGKAIKQMIWKTNCVTASIFLLSLKSPPPPPFLWNLATIINYFLPRISEFSNFLWLIVRENSLSSWAIDNFWPIDFYRCDFLINPLINRCTFTKRNEKQRSRLKIRKEAEEISWKFSLFEFSSISLSRMKITMKLLSHSCHVVTNETRKCEITRGGTNKRLFANLILPV